MELLEPLDILLVNFQPDELDMVVTHLRGDRRFCPAGCEQEEAWQRLSRPGEDPHLLVIAAHGREDAQAARLEAQARALRPGLACAVAGLSRVVDGSARGEALAHIHMALTTARLQRLSADIQCACDLAGVGQRLIQAAREIAEVDEADLLLLDEAGRALRLGRGLYAGQAVPRLFRDAEFVRARVRAGQPFTIADTRADERIHPDFAATGLRSAAAFPIPGPEGARGLLYAFLREPGARLNPAQNNALRALAGHAGQALTAARAREQAGQNNRLMSGLIATGQALTRTKDLQEQVRLVTDFALQQLRVNTFYIGLYDRQRQALRFPVCYDDGERIALEPQPLTESERANWKVAGWVTMEQCPVEWRDLEQRRRVCAELDAQPMRIGKISATALYYPLSAGGRKAGVISFQSYQPRAFSSEMTTIFRALVDQFGVALENAELFEAEQRHHQEAETLRQAALALSQDLDLEPLTEKILSELARVIPYDTASVQVYDREQRAFRIVGGVGFDNLEELKTRRFPVSEHNPNRLVWLQGKTVILEDAPGVYPYLNQPPFDRAGIRSWMGVPMKKGSELIGMIALDKRDPRYYHREHQDLAEAFAAQAALALHNARLLQESREGKNYLKALYQAIAAILTPTDSGLVMRAIVDTICRAAGAWRAAAILMEEPRRPLILAQAGYSADIEPAVAFRPGGVTEQVLASGAPVFGADIRPGDPLFNPDMPAHGVRAAACLPLTGGGRILGVLWIHYDQPRAFPEWEREALEAYGRQSAIAYEHARQLEESAQTRDEIQKMADTSVKGLMGPSLEAVAQAALRVLRCDLVTVYPYNADDDVFLFPPAMAGVANTQAVKMLGAVSDNSVVRKVLDMEDMYESPRAQEDALLRSRTSNPNIQPFVVREKILSMVGVPLKVGERKMGVLFINYRKYHPLTPGQREDIRLFANQAAFGIYSALMHAKAAYGESFFKAVQAASRAIISGPLALDTILERITQQARQLTGGSGQYAHFCNLSLVENGRLVCRAIYPPEMAAEIGPVIQAIDLNAGGKRGLTGEVAERGVSLLAADVSDYDDIYIPFVSSTHSELAVPITFDGKVLGVINVEHEQPGAFDEDDRQKLLALAGMAATAIHNAYLFEEVREGRSYIQTMFEASSRLIGAVDPKAMMNTLVKTVVSSTQAWRAVAFLLDDGDHRPLLAQEGFEDAEEARIPTRATGISRRVMETCRPFFKTEVLPVDDPDVHPVTVRSGARAVACLPLRAGENRCIGVLWIHYREPHVFSDDEQKTLQIFAYQAALACDHAIRYRDLIQTREQLGGSIALAHMGTISSTWRHSIENNAVTIRGSANLIRRLMKIAGIQHETIVENLKTILANADEILEKRINTPLRAEEGIVTFNLNTFLQDSARDMWKRNAFREVEQKMSLDLSRPLEIRASPEWLRRAFEIVIDNAREASQGRERRRVEIRTRVNPDYPDQVEVLVIDNGKGITPEQKKDLLVKQVMKGKDEKGMGVGLLIAQVIFQTYAGLIRIDGSPGQGVTVTIQLPLAPSTMNEG